MGSGRSSTLRRYSLAGLAALLVTIAMLFVMMQLISPAGDSPVVSKMLLELEFERRSPPDTGVRVFELPPAAEIQSAPDGPAERSDLPTRPERGEYDDEFEETERRHVIDWWTEARTVIKDIGEAEFEDWLETQGYKRSVPVGPRSRSGSEGSSGAAGSGYRSVYGDVELPVSENCVLQVRPRHFDSSDFARNIPPLIVCKSAPKKMDLSGLEEYLKEKLGR